MLYVEYWSFSIALNYRIATKLYMIYSITDKSFQFLPSGFYDTTLEWRNKKYMDKYHQVHHIRLMSFGKRHKLQSTFPGTFDCCF